MTIPVCFFYLKPNGLSVAVAIDEDPKRCSQCSLWLCCKLNPNKKLHPEWFKKNILRQMVRSE